MKTFTTTIFALLIFLHGFSQEVIEVTTESKEMSQGMQTSFTVFIPEADIDFVEKKWKNFINDRTLGQYLTKGSVQTIGNVVNGVSNIFSKDKKKSAKTKLKVVKENDELIVRNIIHEDVTQEPFDIYAILGFKETGVEINNFFRYSDSIFISTKESNDDLITALTYYTREFGVDTYRGVVKDQIKKEEKILRKEKSELKKLENRNKSMQNSIGKMESEIDDLNIEIKHLNSDLPRLKKRVTQYKDTLHLFNKESYQYEALKNTKKSYGKDYNKTRNNIKSNKNKIKRNENKIVQLKSDIVLNENGQTEHQARIEQQEAVVEKFQAKHDNIK